MLLNIQLKYRFEEYVVQYCCNVFCYKRGILIEIKFLFYHYFFFNLQAYGQSFKEYSAIPWAKAKHMDDSQFFRSPWVVLVEKKPRNRTPMTVLPQNNDNIDVSPRSRSEICLHGICEGFVTIYFCYATSMSNHNKWIKLTGTHDKNTLNKIENLYRSSPLKDYFGDVIKPRLEITSRTGLNFENMCSMRSRTAYPKTMLNNKNMKKIIANHPTNSKLQQSIQYNYCNNDTYVNKLMVYYQYS